MRRRAAAIFLCFCFALGLAPALTLPARALSVTEEDVGSLVDAANSAMGKTAAQLGLPEENWCAYFVVDRMNHSRMAEKFGVTPYQTCPLAISLASWICASKDGGVFYIASPEHKSRLLNMDPRLGEKGRMEDRTRGGWTPQPGDILEFTWSDWDQRIFDHTGIVVSVSGNTLTYVDGNSSAGCVAAHTLRKDSSAIIGHIRFNKGEDPKPSATYTVHFDANGGNVSETSRTVTEGEAFGPLPLPVRSGYIFCGWYAPDGDRTQVTASTTVKPSDGDITLCAFWLMVKCDHTWDAGTVTRQPTSTEPGERTYICKSCGAAKTEEVLQLDQGGGSGPADPASPEGGDGDCAAQGHSWDEGQVTVPAAADAPGVRVYTCTRCKATREEAVPSGGTLKNFAPHRGAYHQGLFRDVDADVWYAGNVAKVYELGLMKGTGADIFAPEAQVTVAQAVTLAARIHSVYYTGKEAFAVLEGGNWYDPYVDYAREREIISEPYDFAQPATREVFAHILAKALPGAALAPIRSETVCFADAESIICAGDVELLCMAGVITGVQSGEEVKFLPKNTITRAEASAIVARMVEPALRKG